MKILMTSDAVGGVWQYSIDLARGLSDLGVEIVLAVTGPSPSRARLKTAGAIRKLTLIDTGLPLEWLAEDEASVACAGEEIAKLAARHHVDAVHLNSPAFAADSGFNVPVVAVAHSCVASWWLAVKEEPLCERFKWRADMTARGLGAADIVVAPSDAFAKATRDANGLKATPVTVYNGRSALPLPQVAQHDFAFTVGRLWDEGKNLATMDAVAAKLAIPLYAAGPTRGPNGAFIDLQHASSLGTLEEEEIGRWLAARPVFVSAALYEPFGLAVLEAAAAGCPLVLSDIPTFRELWHGAAAFVDPLNAEEFAETIGLIVGDDFARNEMGRAAKARAEHFSVEAMARRMADLYEGLAAKVQVPSSRGMVAA